MRQRLLAIKLSIDKVRLLQACKDMIETILFCLPNAYKGTLYRIGTPPELIAKQITCGVIDNERKKVSWDIPMRSRYAPPGQAWTDYRDQPGRPLEAMAWCVERQHSWTAQDPENDQRGARVKMEGLHGDFHHMEPVLIHKDDLYLGDKSDIEYPRNFQGEKIWQNSDYVVIDVIKIHFRPNTIKINSLETRIIKRLSRVLGTQLLSYQFKQQSIEAMRQLAEDKQNSCNILADSIRNAITKSGFIFSLIKLELGFLREQWEGILFENSYTKNMRHEAVLYLNKAIEAMGCDKDGLGKDLIEAQNRFLGLNPPPGLGKNWVQMQIEERWNELFATCTLDEEKKKEISFSIDNLKKSLCLGQDPDIVGAYDKMPESLKTELVHLLYSEIDRVDFQFLDKLIQVLENPMLNLPHQFKSMKSLVRLKALAEIMRQLELDTNVVLGQILRPHDNGIITNVLHREG
jgi:hypothetical protein